MGRTGGKAEFPAKGESKESRVLIWTLQFRHGSENTE
jgi:hypothetical protein